MAAKTKQLNSSEHVKGLGPERGLGNRRLPCLKSRTVQTLLLSLSPHGYPRYTFFFPLQVFFYEKAQHRIELLKKPVGIPDARTSTAVHKGIQRTGSLLGRPSLRILLLPRASSSQPP